MRVLNNRSKNNLRGVHPQLVHLLEKSITESPVDFTITQGVRSQAEQKQLYAIGRRGIKSEVKVTDKDGVLKKSNHQPKDDGYSYAVDLYPFFDGMLQVTGNDTITKLTEIATHIKKVASELGYKIIWGGDWKMRDMPHFEIRL